MKECYPVEVAEYAVLQNIDHTTASNWWEKHVLRRQDRIISKDNQRGANKYLKRKMKFGIELPKMVQGAMTLENNNDNTLWADVIAKDMRSV